MLVGILMVGVGLILLGFINSIVALDIIMGTMLGIGIKAGVVLLVVLLGWWLAQAQPARRTSSRRRPAGDPQAHRRPTCEQASGKAGEAAGREATGR